MIEIAAWPIIMSLAQRASGMTSVGTERGRIREREVEVVDELRFPVLGPGFARAASAGRAGRGSGSVASARCTAPPRSAPQYQIAKTMTFVSQIAPPARSNFAGLSPVASPLPRRMSTMSRARRRRVGQAQQPDEHDAQRSQSRARRVQTHLTGRHQDHRQQQHGHGRKEPARAVRDARRNCQHQPDRHDDGRRTRRRCAHRPSGVATPGDRAPPKPSVSHCAGAHDME